MKKVYVRVYYAFMMVLLCLYGRGQTTITTTHTNNNGSAMVTFNVENTNSFPIKVTELGCFVGAATQNWQVLYNTSPVASNGSTWSQGVVGAGQNGWVAAATGTTAVSTAGITTLTNTLDITIPPATTYGFSVGSTSLNYQTLTAGAGVNTFSSGGVSIKTGDNISWGGTIPPVTPTNYPRGFIGSITYIPVGPCTVPPTAGTAITSQSISCSGAAVLLNLSGNSQGTGQTYQWQTSPTQNGTYTNIGTSSSNPGLTINPTATAYYRCVVSCSGNAQNSTEVLVTVNPAFAGGTYTINASQPTGGTNFQSFSDAVQAIKCGITGSVVFNVAPGSGPYNESITIPSIIGASSTKTVTFNGNGETIAYNTSDANNRTAIILNGADFIVLDSLNIDVSGGTYGWGIALTNQADSNIIRKCRITTSTTATTTNYAGIITSGSAISATTTGNNANGNLIEKNTIIGGYYAISLYGSTTPYNQNNIVANNTIQDYYYYSVYMYGQQNGVISGNDISRPSRTNAGIYNLYVSSNNGGILIEKNKSHDLFTSVSTATTLYGIYIAGSGTSASPNRLINNTIYNISGNGAIYAVYMLGYTYWNIYHNTIVLDGTTASTGLTYGLYTYGSAGVNIRNNIVYITRSGTGTKYCLYYSTTGVTTSNNNVLFMGSTGGTINAIGYYSSAKTTFADWQATGYDAASSNADPLFVGSGDYTPTQSAINNTGATGLGVTTDITGATRGPSPDPGAYEFSIAGTDAAISWVAPIMPNTTGLKTISVSITNTASNIINSVNLSYTDGLTTQTQNFTGLSIQPLATQTLSFTTQYNVTGNTSFTAYINTANGTQDLSTANDTTKYNLCFALNGNYTINAAQPSSGTNFASFTDAARSLNCGGISGPVVFSVVPGSGPYAESFTLGQISGTSATNTVTFKGNGETLSFNTSDANNRTAIWLNGTDRVIIDSLTIDVAAGTYGWGIVLGNQADSNIIRKCSILTNTSATTTNYAGILINGSANTASVIGNNGNGNIIENNTITGGYYSIYVYGSTSPYNSGNIVRNNQIIDYYYYSIYTYGQQNGTISGNDISRPARTNASSYNLYVSTNNGGMLVEKNKTHDLFTAVTTATTLYGIYIAGSGIQTAPNHLQNNLIYNISGNGTIYGVYMLSYTYWNIYHNTIVLNDQTATTAATYGLYAYGTAGVNIKNNIVYISRSGTGAKYCLYYSTTGVTSSNNNVLYMGSTGGTTNAVGYYNSAKTTLADWKTANASWDQQSVDYDPLFTSATDYTPTASTTNNLGTPVGVLTDINNAVRSTSTPDIGAYEFSTLTSGVNMLAQSLVAPAISAKGCYSTENVIIKIRNSSVDTIFFATKPVTVITNVTGAVSQALSKIVNTGFLAPDSTLDVTMSQTLNMTNAGIYYFDAFTSVSGDTNPGNDAMQQANRETKTLTTGTLLLAPQSYCVTGGKPVLSATGAEGYSTVKWQSSTSANGTYTDISGATTVPFTSTVANTQSLYYKLLATCGTSTVTSGIDSIILYNPVLASTTPGSTCGTGTVTLSATASNGGSVNWYAAATGGLPISTGNVFTTPSISTTTTYYAAASSGGIYNQPIGGAGSAWNTLTTTGSFQSTSSVSSASMIFDALQPLTISEMDIYPSSAVGSSFTLEVRAGTSTGTLVATYTGTTTVQNSGSPSVAQTLPVNFVIPAAGTYYVGFSATNPGCWRSQFSTPYPFPVTLAGLISVTNANASGATGLYWYYIYNWKISTGCESARTAVTATVNATPGCSTPVTFTAFTGERRGNANQLSWSTATESNNKGFELQRSVDGTTYTSISFVNSKAENGNSNQALNYAYTDEKIAATASYYYRLKQVDKDGKYNYSNAVFIKGAKATKLELVSVYPNPAKDQLNVSIASPKADNVTLIVTDMTGKVVLQQRKSVANGDNLLQLNVQPLSQGSYLLKAICADGCETAVSKFMKN